MGYINEAAQELAHLRGNLQFSDLKYSNQIQLILGALQDSEIDLYDLYIEDLDIHSLIKKMLQGIFEEDVKDEIIERLIEYFEPIFNERLASAYHYQYEMQEAKYAY